MQAARRYRIRRKAELPKVEIAAFQGKVTIEFVPAEYLESKVTVVIVDRGRRETIAQQAGGDSSVVNCRS